MLYLDIITPAVQNNLNIDKIGGTIFLELLYCHQLQRIEEEYFHIVVRSCFIGLNFSTDLFVLA